MGAIVGLVFAGLLLYALVGIGCAMWHLGEEDFRESQAALWPIYLPLVWLPRGLVRVLGDLGQSWRDLAAELDRADSETPPPKDPASK